MGFKINLSSKKMVGIDIGYSSIKILELSRAGSKYTLDSIDLINLPSGIVSDGFLKDHASAISYIKSSFANHGMKDKNVVISIPCKHVIIKNLDMPKMKESELDSAIFYEAQQYITYDIKEVSFDYEILGDSAADAGSNLIMIIAGKKDIINDRVDLMNECGLHSPIVDVDCIATENMFNFNYPEETEQMAGIIKVGATETNVHIVNKGFNLFRRDIPIGGVNITEEIAKKFQMDFNEAENVKTGGIEKRDENFKTNYMIYINMIVARITSEIQRTIDYFAANNDKQYPKKIFLTGGSAMLSGLSGDIESKLNIPVSIINPFRKIVFSNNIDDKSFIESKYSLFGVAVGLVVRGLEP
jgi:type IV pilus assembly protein PilM